MSDLYHHNALPPGSTVDEYRLIEVLGEGGFGIVYRGEGRYLGDQVAIKEYLPRHLATRTEGTTVAPTSSDSEEAYSWGLKKFQEEARILWKLAQPERHPNIVAVRRFFEANGTTYMVMDFEEARPLSDLLKGNATLPQKRLEAALFSLLSGLKRVHEAGVWHRDIKPANILIRADGSPVLLDFGAARQTLDKQTRSVVAAITPPYAAFEQYAARGNDGPWTDIYALGVTLYRCVTGELPPEAAERADEDNLVLLAERDLPGYSQEFLSAIDSALAVRAKDRPQSVDDWRALFNPSESASADLLDSGGDTTVLRTAPPLDAVPDEPDVDRSPSALVGERERISESRQGDSASNKRLAVFGAVIAALVIAGVAASVTDLDALFGESETEAWNQAQQAGSAASIFDFIERFPDGAHIAEARGLLAKIEQEKRAAEAARAEEQRVAAADRVREEAAVARREADENAWNRAQAADSIEGYSAYLSQQSDGVFATQASNRIDVLKREQQAWEQASSADTLKAYQDFLAAFPDAAQAEGAQRRIAELEAQAKAQAEAETKAASEAQAKAAREAEERRRSEREAALAQERESWASAERTDSIEGYQDYLSEFGDGANAAAARDKIAALEQQARANAEQAEADAWQQAEQANNATAYRSYIENHPDGRQVKEAEKRIADLLTPVVTETAGRYAARRNVNIRSKPSREGAILGSLKTGNEVDVTARVAVAGETWLRIDRGGREAFVYGSLLREMPREEIIAWNELRILLDESFGDPVSPKEKVVAISRFVEAFPDSHRVAEAEAEAQVYQEEAAQIEARAQAEAQAAKQDWEKVDGSEDPEAYQDYLEKHPVSEFASQAKAVLDNLLAAVSAERAAKAEAERREAARKEEEAKRAEEARQRELAEREAAAAAQNQNGAQTSATAFPEPSISRDEMQDYFEDNEFVLRQIITEYNRKNRIHVRGAAADPRATKIFSLSVRSALPPSVGDGRYADVNFAVKDGRNEIFRPFRFGILWNDGEPEVISHSRLK